MRWKNCSAVEFHWGSNHCTELWPPQELDQIGSARPTVEMSLGTVGHVGPCFFSFALNVTSTPHLRIKQLRTRQLHLPKKTCEKLSAAAEFSELRSKISCEMHGPRPINKNIWGILLRTVYQFLDLDEIWWDYVNKQKITIFMGLACVASLTAAPWHLCTINGAKGTRISTLTCNQWQSWNQAYSYIQHGSKRTIHEYTCKIPEGNQTIIYMQITSDYLRPPSFHLHFSTQNIRIGHNYPQLQARLPKLCCVRILKFNAKPFVKRHIANSWGKGILLLVFLWILRGAKASNVGPFGGFCGWIGDQRLPNQYISCKARSCSINNGLNQWKGQSNTIYTK